MSKIDICISRRAMVTGTVAHNVSLLARYVSPVKKSESS